MEDLGVWDCRNGTHDAIAAFYGRIVSHLHLTDRRLNVRFTDGSTIKFIVLEGGPEFLAIKVVLGNMATSISNFLTTTNHPELDRFIGTEFTAFRRNRLEFGTWCIQLDQDEITLLQWQGAPSSSVN